MHPNPAFRWPRSASDHNDADERAALEALIANIGFGMIFAETPDGPRVAHVPVYSTGDGALQFHLSRGNALTKHIAETKALCVINGPDAYVSPDWYDMDDQVPTWNYLALELEGPVREIDRKSTRLNSSHDQISYAVFCLKKKKEKKNKKSINISKQPHTNRIRVFSLYQNTYRTLI